MPIVKFMCGQQETIKPVRWTFKVAGGLFLTRKQVPLKLAWAISIHKSQVREFKYCVQGYSKEKID